MNIHLLYVAVDAVSIALMLIIAARFLQQAPKHKGAWLVALIALGAISYVLSARQDYGPLIAEPFRVDFGGFFPLLNLLRNATSAFFMLLCHTIFREGKPAPRALLVLLTLQLFIEEPLGWIIGTEWASPALATLIFEAVPAAIQLVFLACGLYWILSEREADLVATRRKARVFILIVYVVQVLLSLAIERVAMGFDLIPWTMQYPIHVITVGIGIATSLAILYALMSPGTILLIDPSRTTLEPSKPPEADASEAELARIKTALKDEHIYRQAGLSVGALARHLSIPEYRLRTLIHRHLGYRNFNALLHRYRIEEVSAGLADPKQNATPVLTLALSAGYQSVNPFNRAFREANGMTPTEYRRFVQKNGVDSSNTTPNRKTDQPVK